MSSKFNQNTNAQTGKSANPSKPTTVVNKGKPQQGGKTGKGDKDNCGGKC